MTRYGAFADGTGLQGAGPRGGPGATPVRPLRGPERQTGCVDTSVRWGTDGVPESVRLEEWRAAKDFGGPLKNSRLD